MKYNMGVANIQKLDSRYRCSLEYVMQCICSPVFVFHGFLTSKSKSSPKRITFLRTEGEILPVLATPPSTRATVFLSYLAFCM